MDNGIRIQRYQPEDKKLWDNFVTNAKNGLFLFYRNYIEYHKERFQDHSLIIFKKNQIIALLPAAEDNKVIISHNGLTFGGLITSLRSKASEVIEIIEEVIKYYNTLQFKSFIYKAVPGIFQKYPAQEDIYALFVKKAELIKVEISSVIDLSSPIPFSKTKRQIVSKSEKKSIVVQESQNFSEFWSLLGNNLLKHKTQPTHTLEEISMLKNLFKEEIRLYVAKLENKLLAGVVIYDFGSVAHTQYMANSTEGRKLGALNYINYYLINHVFKLAKYYSFGKSTENDGLVLNEGLILQKELMGARGIVQETFLLKL